VASRVPIDEEVYMVNISIPEPESIEWLLPESDAYEIVAENDQMLGMVFHEYGEYTIGMRTYVGKCYAVLYKSIRVMDKFDIENYEDADEAMLRSFTVFPNPARGQFTVNIELKEENPVTVYLINSGTGKVIDRKEGVGNKVYNEVFRLSDLPKGTYVVSLVSPKAKAVQKIILY
jgi:hypothetical protein